MNSKKNMKKNRVSTIQIPCTTEQYEKAVKLRGDRTWLEFILGEK